MFYLYKAKDNAEEIMKKAKQGDPEAQFALGRYYSAGRHIDHSPEEAVKWYRLAAEQGNAKAQRELGVSYYTGNGVEQNYEEAVKWFSKCGSANWLGECYLHGHGVERNVEKTIELWESIADGSYDMVMKLGHLYGDGIEMEPDYQKAAHWWYVAAFADYDDTEEGGIPEARYELACYYYEGKGVRKNRKVALRYFKQTIDAFHHYEGERPLSEEPEYVINSRKMLVRHGNRSMIRKLQKAAENDDNKASEILKEFGIEIVKCPPSKTDVKQDTREIKPIPKTRNPKPPVELSIGEKVCHKSFGEGTVYEMDGQYIRIEFKTVGKKSFVNPQAFEDGFLVKPEK